MDKKTPKIIFSGKAPLSFLTGKKTDENILVNQLHIISEDGIGIEDFRKWGSIGGKTSASKMTVEERRERARKGGKGKKKNK